MTNLDAEAMMSISATRDGMAKVGMPIAPWPSDAPLAAEHLAAGSEIALPDGRVVKLPDEAVLDNLIRAGLSLLTPEQAAAIFAWIDEGMPPGRSPFPPPSSTAERSLAPARTPMKGSR